MRRVAIWNPLSWFARVAARRNRTFWLRLVCGSGVLLGLCLLARNPIARRAGMFAGSYALNTRVDIGKLDIQWSQIVVDDVTVFEPAVPNQIQLQVARIAIAPTLWRGMSEGIWVERIAISRPTLHVRFDEQGELLSVFPQGSGGDTNPAVGAIPLRYLTVQDAGLVVHQVGRTDLRVENVDVTAEFSDAIVARARVPSILAGEIDFQCDLDAKTFAGTTKLNVLGIKLDTQQLARLPLVPKTLGDEPATASLALSMRGTHPPSETDLRQHALECIVSTRDVRSQRYGRLCHRFDVDVKQADGVARIDTHADPLGGDFRLQASADFNHPAITAEMKTTLQNCQIGHVTKHFPELAELAAIAMGQASASMAWHDGKLDFRGDAKPELQEIAFDSMVFPAVTAQVSTHGTFSTGAVHPLQGVLKGSFATTSLQLSQVAKRFELPEIVGEVLASGSIDLPLDRLTDPTSYRAEARVELRDIAGVQMNVPNSGVSATLSDGIATVDVAGIHLQDINGKSIADVKGLAVASLGDQGRLDANAEVRLEPSQELISALGLSEVQPSGRLSCRVEGGCLLSELASPRAWSVTAVAQSQAVAIAGEEISDIQLHAKLSDGQLTASPLVVKWRDNTCTIQAEGEVNDSISVCGKLTAAGWKLQDASEVISRFSKSPLPVTGLANVDGQLLYRHDLTSGTKTLHGFGNANLEQAVFSRTRIGDAGLRWLANLDGLVLSTSSDDFLGGRFDVNARVAELDWTKTSIDGTFAEVQVARLVSLTRQRVPSTGIVEGGFNVTSIASLSDLTGDAWMRSRQLTLQRVPLELAQTHVTVQQGIVHAGGDGQIAEGRFHATAQASLVELTEFFARPNPPLAETPIVAQFRLDSMPMAPVAMALQLPREMRSLGGTLSADVLRDEAARDGRHLATVAASVDNVRWKHAQLSNRITADLVVHPTQVELNSVQGRFADGNLSGKAIVALESTPTGRFEFVASRVNLRRATSAFGIADVSGSGTVKLRGRLGHLITGRADVTVENAVAAGVDVRQIRLPIDWTVTPTAKTVRWQCRAGSVSVGGGNVRIATHGSYAKSLNMNSTVRVERVDLSKLMQHGSAGSGIVDGVVIVRAKHARSPQQFVGTYDFEMKNIHALDIPVLNQLPKMVSLSPPVPGRGQDGATIRGRIGGGLVHVDEIAVHQSNVQVLVSGKATLQGKLDLDVIVSTESTSPTDQLVSMLDSPLMLAAPAPVALIAKANDLLKDRVVRLHVGGTAGYPTLRLQPGKQLTQDAVRFFLTNSFGSAATQVSDLGSKSQLR